VTLSLLLNVSRNNEMKKLGILYKISINQTGKITSLWLPLPLDTDYQKLVSLNYEGNYSESGIFKENIYNTPMLYAEWKDGRFKKGKGYL